jgi:hypothetical protein
MSREGNPLQIWACKQAVIVLGLIFFWDLSGPDLYVNVTIPRYFSITQIDSLKLARNFCQKYPYLHLWWDTRLCVKQHHMLTLIGCFWCHFVADTFWTNEWIKLSFIQINTSSHNEFTSSRVMKWPVFKNLVFTGHMKMELFGSVCDIVDFQNAHFWSHIYLHIQVVNCPISQYSCIVFV